MKDDLCRQFQSEALRLGLWHMNLVVPEAQLSQQHLHLDLRCRQIKTIAYLLSIPAGFPSAFELRPVLPLPFSFVTPHFFLHSSLSHILHIQSISKAALYASEIFLLSTFFSSPLKEISEFGLLAPFASIIVELFFKYTFLQSFSLGKIFQSKSELSTLTPRMFVYLSPPLNSKN